MNLKEEIRTFLEMLTDRYFWKMVFDGANPFPRINAILDEAVDGMKHKTTQKVMAVVFFLCPAVIGLQVLLLFDVVNLLITIAVMLLSMAVSSIVG